MTTQTPHRGLHRGNERVHLIWDLTILALVIINLALLIIDSLFLIPALNTAFETVAPQGYRFYDETIHENFFTIDLVFVSIFLLDVLLGWAVAIAERRYPRWFYYPFVHWYDVLGCIPLAGLRWLRALRVFSLLYRLQRLRLIDVRTWPLAEGIAKYYDILLEEVSDRVAIRLIGSVQEEIRNSDAFSRRIAEEIIAPRKQQLVDEITQRLEATLGDTCRRNQPLIARYVSALVGRTMQDSPEIQRLRRLPFGDQLATAMDQTISDIANRLVREAIVGLNSPEFTQLIRQMADSGFDALLITDRRTDRITERVLIDVLELLKEQVAVKQWRDKYAEHDMAPPQ
ncbi:ion transporter [Halomonas sp. McH1-25]|uniref:ion transporter n=1 Tax=unclassified Halomonas TaxID=2609666 RepID=UPI001EF6E554|nr:MULTISPECIES: ion transporter [unclassified Halomonas]MCG7601412.1 ion transporter [Halomonas sp. McH1-25]MCP1341953.1 ion transporter [Halomonas sp. FL8]MCP1362293.1 ion transporter [Halomonas sp. BBD45]MCP1365031.1 ion transporter [Halomonas sp. BBD48]